MRRRIVDTVARLLLLVVVATPPVAFAELERAGPNDAFHGFPQWYQDKTGLMLDFCSPVNQAELEGGWCLMFPPFPTPEVFPDPFSDEHFYWAGDSIIGPPKPGHASDPNLFNPYGMDVKLVLGLEAAFATGAVVAGDQMVFGRVRFDGTAPFTGDYVFYTPFGVFDVKGQVQGGRIFFTEDIGIACAPGRFDCALTSSIGPFLLPSNSPGGPELPPVPILDPNTGCAPDVQNPGLTVCDMFWPAPPTPYPFRADGSLPKYIADPARGGPVTGSKFPDFVSPATGETLNHNRFRVEFVPAGAPAGTVPTLIADTTWFTLMGRIYEGAVAARVTLDRASYARPVPTETANKVDVYATALPAGKGRIPPQAAAAPEAPQLVFYEAPCGVDATGALTRPMDPLTGIALPQVHMYSVVGWKHVVGQSAPATIPTHVCLEQTNATDVAGHQVSVFSQAPVGDQIFLTSALFDPNVGTLTVAASSSDRTFPPELTVAGFGPVNPITGLMVANTLVPPNKVTVVSTAGGLNQRQVATEFWATATNAFPIAADDAATLLEDAPATTIAVTANDTMAGAELPANALVTIVTPPNLGTAVVNADGTISYTPNRNAFGPDAFQYRADLNGFPSNTANVAITITPVNDVPVAANDTLAAAVNPAAPAAVPLNVFANDTDADGGTDLDLPVNVTLTSSPAGAPPPTLTPAAGGIVNFTASVAGTYRFTYQAQDKGGGAVPAVPALSNVATVTVVASQETITVAKAEYITRQSRWVVAGNASPSGNQRLTVAYADGPNAGLLLHPPGGGPTVVNGSWTFDFRPATGALDPSTPANAATTSVVITGPGGGRAVATFRIK